MEIRNGREFINSAKQDARRALDSLLRRRSADTPEIIRDRKEMVERGVQNKFKKAKKEVRDMRKADEKGREVTNKGEKQKKIVKSFAELVAATEKGLDVVPQQVRPILQELASRDLNYAAVESSLYFLGDYFTGDKQIASGGRFTDEFRSDIQSFMLDNHYTAEMILDAINKHRGEYGVTYDEIQILKGEKRESGATSKKTGFDKIERYYKDSRVLGEELKDYLKYGIRFNEGVLEVEVRSERGCDSDPGLPDCTPEAIRAGVESRKSVLIADIRMLVTDVPKPGEKVDSVKRRKMQEVDRLRGLGYIDNDTADKLKEFVGRYTVMTEKYADIDQILAGNSLSMTARTFKITISEEGNRIMRLIDNPAIFDSEIKDPGSFYHKRYVVNGRIDFAKLYDDILNLGEEVISMIDYTPDQNFDASFSPYYEGAFYKQLIRRVQQLGEELDKFELGSSIVEVEDTMLLANPNQDGIGGEERMSYRVRKRKTLAEAFREDMSSGLAKLLKVNRSLHDIEYIVDNGLGWDKLAQFVGTLSSEDVDWLFSRDPELIAAYQLYIQNLKNRVALNNRIIDVDFGKKTSEGFDNEQLITRNQLLAMRGDDSGIAGRRVARKVRLATAIAKGFSGEFWGVLMTSSMPMSYEGNLVYDSEGRVIGVKHKQKAIFTGPHHSGVEKMLMGIDPVKMWERFGDLPHWAPMLRFMFMPRDTAKYEGWDHTLVYEVGDKYKEAFFMGADEDFLEFLKDHVLMADVLRVPSIDIFQRLGWRPMQYKAFLRFKESEVAGRRIDFQKSLATMMAAGTLPTRVFIDHLEDVVKEAGFIDISTLPDDMSGNIKRLFSRLNTGAITDDEKKILTQFMYERYIFKRALNTSPTRVIGFERRVYTPKKESLVGEDLQAFLMREYPDINPGLIRNKILPLYIEAINIAEKNKWVKNKNKALEILQNSNASPAEVKKAYGLLDYTFSLEDLLNPEVQKQVNKYFEKMVNVTILQYQGRDIELSKIITPEKFRTTLPGFFTEMRNSINKTRVRGKGERNYLKEPKGIRYSADITLEERFYHWAHHLKILDYDLGADDLDFRLFAMEQAGRNVHGRSFGDTANVAKEIVPSMQKLFLDRVADFTKQEFKDNNKMMEYVGKEIIPLAHKITDVMDKYAGKPAADEMAIRLAQAFRRAVGEDSDYDNLFIGWAKRRIHRAYRLREQSLLQDFFPSTYERPTTALNAGQQKMVELAIANACNVPLRKENPDGYETKTAKLLGIKLFKYRKKKTKENKFSIEGSLKPAEGFTFGRELLNRYGPIATIALLMILIMLIRQALKKDKE